MSKSIEQLAHERGRLLERVAHQRHMLIEQFVPLQKAAAAGDRAIATTRSFGQYLSNHRAVIGMAVTVLGVLFVVFRPGTFWRLLRRSFVLWRSWRALQAMGLFVPGTPWGAVVNTIRHRYFKL